MGNSGWFNPLLFKIWDMETPEDLNWYLLFSNSMSLDWINGNELSNCCSSAVEYFLIDLVKTQVTLNLSSGQFSFLLPREIEIELLLISKPEIVLLLGVLW